MVRSTSSSEFQFNSEESVDVAITRSTEDDFLIPLLIESMASCRYAYMGRFDDATATPFLTPWRISRVLEGEEYHQVLEAANIVKDSWFHNLPQESADHLIVERLIDRAIFLCLCEYTLGGNPELVTQPEKLAQFVQFPLSFQVPKNPTPQRASLRVPPKKPAP